MYGDARPNTAELLARLPPLPDVKRPFFGGPDHRAKDLDEGDLTFIEEMISGRFLDFMLNELLGALPDVTRSIDRIGPAGLVLQARPSNTINALTVPTRDGVVIVYNLGFYSMFYSVSTAIALVVARPVDGAEAKESAWLQALEWLSNVVDWATSRAKEPRNTVLPLDDEQQSLATNFASRAQRFGMCHELGHVIAFDHVEQPVRTANVEGVAVSALRDTWEKEYDADRDGLDMYLRVLASGGQSPSAHRR